jgi:hypothetical protein
MWYWSLPIQPSASALQTRVDVLAEDAAALADEAVYGGGGPRHHLRAAVGATGTLSAKRKGPQLPAVSPPLAQCVWEGMSNPSIRRVAQKIRGNHSLR